MLARRIPTILPCLTIEESIETTRIHSVAGILNREQALVSERPFRSPHHTISDIALTGGGSIPRPGEISLSHNGVLFLDELPEFRRNTLEVLRQPLEDGIINVARVASSVTYPSKFMLICAMNPCPCGYFSDPARQCVCSPGQIQKYRARISGPLLDRIDLHIDVPAVKYRELCITTPNETSSQIRHRVQRSRDIQKDRYKKDKHIHCNAHITPRQITQYCRRSPAAEKLLQNAIEHMGFSARAYDRILKVARTVADIALSEIICEEHIAEAIQYRSLDRSFVA